MQVMVYRVGRLVRAAVVGGQRITIPATAKRVGVYQMDEGDDDAATRALARFTVDEWKEAGKPCPSEAELMAMMQ